MAVVGNNQENNLKNNLMSMLSGMYGQHPGPTGIFSLVQIINSVLASLQIINSTPSNDPLSRRGDISFWGKKGDLANIEQLRFEVFHPGAPSAADATQASLFMTLDSVGLVEVLRLYQDSNHASSGLGQIVINPQPYFDDLFATLAILAPPINSIAKLKIATAETGGGEHDGINFEVLGNLIKLKFGTSGQLIIPRAGGGSDGQIIFYPDPASGKDFIGINSTASAPPKGPLSVYKQPSPYIVLQAFYWDSSGPHSALIKTQAEDGTIGEMGWEQTNFPSQWRKSKWISKATNSAGTFTEYLEHDDEHMEYKSPNCALKVTASNVFYSNATVTDEGLRNEERLSRVTYINDLSDFPTSLGDIWFTEGMWDANNIPFAITQDIYLNKGAIVRNLNITTSHKIDIGTDASANPEINLQNAKINFTATGGHNIGLLGGESKTSIYNGFTLNCIDCEFRTSNSARFVNFSYGLSFTPSTASIKFKNCKFYDGACGTISVFGSISLQDIELHNISGGFFLSNVKDIFLSDIRVVSKANDDVIPIMLTSVEDSLDHSFETQAVIRSVIQDADISFYLMAQKDYINAAISGCNLLNNDLGAFAINKILHSFTTEFGLTGYMKEGQIVTGSTSGAYGVIIAYNIEFFGTASPSNWYLKQTSVVPFISGEPASSSTGSVTALNVIELPGLAPDYKKIIAKGNIGIPDSSAFVQASYSGTPVATGLPSNQTLRIVAPFLNRRSERFNADASGTIEYIGLDTISVNLSFDALVALTTAPKTAIFYPVRGNVNNTIFAIADLGAGYVRISTVLAHDYSALDTTILEDTTVYDGSYIISSVSDAYNYDIFTGGYSGTSTGFHSRVIKDNPLITQLTLSASHNSTTWPIDDIKTGDYIFYAAEVLSGDVLKTSSINISAVKTG